MEVNKIQEELARLIELVDGWAGSHDVPGIERDLVLDKLKKLYEAIPVSYTHLTLPTNSLV